MEKERTVARPAVKARNTLERKSLKTVLIAFNLTETEQKLVEGAILFSPEKIGNYILFNRLVKKAFTETMKKFNSPELKAPPDSGLVNHVLSLVDCSFSSSSNGGKRKRTTRLPLNDTISFFLKNNPVHISRLFKLCYLLASLKILVFVAGENLAADRVKR